MKEGNEKRILIVEDEPSYIKVLSLKLRKAGFSVKVAVNGQEALDDLKNSEVDLVLLDLLMPRMDGFIFLQRIREEGIDLPVIVLTNLAFGDHRERVENFGIIDFFIKSDVSLKFIVDYIKKFLEVK